MTLHDCHHRTFASDNYAGIHPEVLAAIAAANGGHQRAYGGDAYTARLGEVVRAQFGAHAQVFPVFNGTGANVVALTSMLPRWGAVIAATTSHINTDEGGAPERISGIKILPVRTSDGKLTPELVAQQAWGWGNEHRAQPLVVSITQTTELGTLYTPNEIADLCDFAHSHDMAVHLDGSRLWNAAAALGCSLGEITSAAGVDVISLGGTKNGLMSAEAVVIIDPHRATGVPYVRKLTAQLSSKMRFQSAQLLALFDDDLGIRLAGHANAMATRLRDALETDGIPADMSFTQPTQANAVLARLPIDAADRIREQVAFYDWDRAAGEVRWMTSWDTTTADVDGFAALIRQQLHR
ncbi:MAG: low specificity L-threonine aldolase [Gordonia sp. (in: high G+C Gram-positive bacteria)]